MTNAHVFAHRREVCFRLCRRMDAILAEKRANASPPDAPGGSRAMFGDPFSMLPILSAASLPKAAFRPISAS